MLNSIFVAIVGISRLLVPCYGLNYRASDESVVFESWKLFAQDFRCCR